MTWTIDAPGSDSGWSLSGSPPNQSLIFSPTTLAAGTTSRVHLTSSTTTNSCGDFPNTAAFTSDAGPGQASDSVTVDCAPPPPPATYTETVQADSPIAYWRLGETSGASAADSSGHGHTGSYENGVTLGVPGALSGDPNKAARFDGNKGDVSASDSPDLRLNGSWTIEFWARQITFVGTAPGILDKGTPGNSSDYSITADSNGALTFERNNKQVSTGNGALTSSYRYFAITYDGSRVRWYVNGVLTATAAVTFQNGGSSHPFAIAKGVSHDFAHDDIDEVALYASSLSASRVAAHYTAGS